MTRQVSLSSFRMGAKPRLGEAFIRGCGWRNREFRREIPRGLYGDGILELRPPVFHPPDPSFPPPPPTPPWHFPRYPHTPRSSPVGRSPNVPLPSLPLSHLTFSPTLRSSCPLLHRCRNRSLRGKMMIWIESERNLYDSLSRKEWRRQGLVKRAQDAKCATAEDSASPGRDHAVSITVRRKFVSVSFWHRPSKLPLDMMRKRSPPPSVATRDV